MCRFFRKPKRLMLLISLSIVLFICPLGTGQAGTITFDTNFETGIGQGTIVDQDPNALARIFKYKEKGVFATAIPFTQSEPDEAPSHYHMFDAATLGVGVDNIGLLMGDDSSGVQFTVGGMSPTTPFNVKNLEIFQVGEDEEFDGTVFLRSFRGSEQAGEILLSQGFTGSPTFDGAEWNNITHFTATFGVPGAEPPEGGRLVIDNLQVKPVPEPSTIGLLGLGLAGLLFLRRKRAE